MTQVNNLCNVVQGARDNIAQEEILFNVVKTLSNVVLEASDNIAQKKNLFNVVLILLEQHCTSKYPMQCGQI